MLAKKKHYFVPWEGYAKNNQPDERGHLDRLCLQGPHTLERAEELAKEIRSNGFLASVIDCTETLKYAHSARAMLKALLLAEHALTTGENCQDAASAVSDAIAQARGEL